MSDKQPEALRLADALNNLEATGYSSDTVQLTEWSCRQADAAAAALIRQHALIAELVEALQNGLKTADFERHPFRPWHAEARAAISKAKEQP